MATDDSVPDGHLLRLTYTSGVTRLLPVSQLVDLIVEFENAARQSVGRDLGLHVGSAFELLEKFRVNVV